MSLNIEEIKELNKLPLEELMSLARSKTDAVHGKAVFLRGLIEFSNYCSSDCLFCGIRRSNLKVNRYRLSEEEILDAVSKGYKSGLKTFVLQSGEDKYYTTERVCSLLSSIKKIVGESAAVTLSMGVRSLDEYRELKAAGADRYLMRFETADRDLHKYLKGSSLDNRLEALDNIRKAGFEVGSGFMVGLPGEKEDTLVENIKLACDLQINMGGIGPFIPHDDTPLRGAEQKPIELVLRATALLRLALPQSHIPATTASGSLDPLGREKSIQAGANVLMPNITPLEVKKDYLLYPGKICLDEDGGQCIGCMSHRVETVGCYVDYSIGKSL